MESEISISILILTKHIAWFCDATKILFVVEHCIAKCHYTIALHFLLQHYSWRVMPVSAGANPINSVSVGAGVLGLFSMSGVFLTRFHSWGQWQLNIFICKINLDLPIWPTSCTFEFEFINFCLWCDLFTLLLDEF